MMMMLIRLSTVRRKYISDDTKHVVVQGWHMAVHQPTMALQAVALVGCVYMATFALLDFQDAHADTLPAAALFALKVCEVPLSSASSHVAPATRPYYCVEEATLVTAVFAAMLGAAIAFVHFVRHEYTLAFPVLQQGRWFRMKARLRLVAQRALYTSSVIVGLSLVLWLVLPSLVRAQAALLLRYFHGFVCSWPWRADVDADLVAIIELMLNRLLELMIESYGWAGLHCAIGLADSRSRSYKPKAYRHCGTCIS